MSEPPTGITLTDHEHQAYRDFCLGQFRRLGTATVDIDEPVWHYTRGQSLIDILRSGQFWTTHVSCLNDSTEINYGSNLLAEALRGMLVETESHLALNEFARYYLSLLSNPGSGSEDQASSPYYVGCFSKTADSLSQWRAYSDGENGFAIGFSPKEISEAHLLCAVSYDRSVHASVANDVASATLDFYLKGLGDRPGIDGMK